MDARPTAGPLGRLLSLFRRTRRRVLLHRRLLAALAAGSAVLVALQAAAPPPPETVSVWTARRDLAGGTRLTAGDLVETRYPPEAVPSGAVRSPASVAGRVLAAPLLRGEPVTSVRTVARGLLRGYPGTTAVPLRITDAAVVDLLRVGDRVGFVVADPDGRGTPTLLVDNVPVVAIPEAAESGLGTGTPGRLVVAAIPSTEASEVAAAAATSILIPVWSR